VPPRYRRRRAVAEAGTAAAEQAAQDGAPVEEERRTPVVVGVAGVNGATALGARSHHPDRRKAGTSR
jgi:UDP-GlcNAc:undecaprenyl-phosphate GlcNAc-1-phosphate transferase